MRVRKRRKKERKMVLTLFDNKRGSGQDLILAGLYILVFGMVVLIGFRAFSSIDSELQSNGLISAAGKTASTSLLDMYPGIIDNTFLLFAVGVGLVTLVVAALVRVHPIFIPIFFLLWIFTIFISGVFSNVYQEVAGSAEFVAYADQLTFATTLIKILPIFVGVFGFILMIVMYRSWEGAR